MKAPNQDICIYVIEKVVRTQQTHGNLKKTFLTPTKTTTQLTTPTSSPSTIPKLHTTTYTQYITKTTKNPKVKTHAH